MTRPSLPLTHFTPVLDLQAGHLSLFAASGLVRDANWFYCIADDELSLFRFRPLTESTTPLFADPLVLIQGDLPQDARARKKQKPDWEALTWLAPNQLLIVPSGSKPQRRTGFWLTPSDEMSDQMRSRPIDFSPLYLELEKQFPELNIEGAIANSESLFLFQRGNGSRHDNALIELDLSLCLEDLAERACLSASSIRQQKKLDLGLMNETPLGFTDAAWGPDGRIWFLAVAERAESTYEDGDFAGARLGSLSPAGDDLRWIGDLSLDSKPEGLWIDARGVRPAELWIVTDADRRDQVSRLYRGEIQNIS